MDTPGSAGALRARSPCPESALGPPSFPLFVERPERRPRTSPRRQHRAGPVASPNPLSSPGSAPNGHRAFSTSAQNHWPRPDPVGAAPVAWPFRRGGPRRWKAGRHLAPKPQELEPAHPPRTSGGSAQPGLAHQPGRSAPANRCDARPGPDDRLASPKDRLGQAAQAAGAQPIPRGCRRFGARPEKARRRASRSIDHPCCTCQGLPEQSEPSKQGP
ncbi:hypothetical protein KOAAANKH_02383 [Brevundimonas sp. NIBR10]|nr:hypothetical protein KOAAANKH_02383 [Brevundimonas sp. NIBR10]